MHFWQGEKVKLRSVEPEDVQFFFQWNQDTTTHAALDRIWCPGSLQRQKDWIRSLSENKDDDDYFFVIEDLNGNIAGSISTHHCDRRNGHFSFGLAIVQEKRRQGYASEAIRLVLNYYFNELRYHKVTVDVFAGNEPSVRLHEKLGFQREGRLREMKYTNGGYADVLKYGLLRDEFIRSLRG